MYAANGEESINSEVRRYATQLFRRIAQQVNGKEVMMLAMEKMSMVDWDDIVSDEEKSIRETIKMVEYFEIFGEGKRKGALFLIRMIKGKCIRFTKNTMLCLNIYLAVERLESPTMILDRIVYPTHYCSKAIQFLETILYEYSSWGDHDRPASQWDNILFVVTNSLLDFVEYCTRTTTVNTTKHPLFNEKLESVSFFKTNNCLFDGR